MHPRREVIDVDRIVLDLTKDIPIDLTDDTDITEKRKVESDGIIVIDDDDDDLSLFDYSKASQLRDGATKRFLELDSDGEDIEGKSNKQRQEENETDEEEAYTRCHAGYDINNEDIWKPPKGNQEKITFDFPENLECLFVSDASSSNPKPRRRQPDFSSPHAYPFTKLVEWKPLVRSSNA
ncbi:hypothetical protein C0993_002068 [Termitomyces sp. T159_Od127]|nr:hypothetical protein C0993_002068 [Termitomyces sp. T159_Od127]